MDVDNPDLTWSKECSCGATIERWRGQSDVTCDNCEAEYNALGQRLRTGWRDNASNYDSDIDDMDGYETSHYDY